MLMIALWEGSRNLFCWSLIKDTSDFLMALILFSAPACIYASYLIFTATSSS